MWTYRKNFSAFSKVKVKTDTQKFFGKKNFTHSKEKRPSKLYEISHEILFSSMKKQSFPKQRKKKKKKKLRKIAKKSKKKQKKPFGLICKGKWFDKIKGGSKTLEYWRNTRHWRRRLLGLVRKRIRFIRGMTGTSCTKKCVRIYKRFLKRGGPEGIPKNI